ncbi:aliphatic nitrilase [Cryomyces antarcticus]
MSRGSLDHCVLLYTARQYYNYAPCTRLTSHAGLPYKSHYTTVAINCYDAQFKYASFNKEATHTPGCRACNVAPVFLDKAATVSKTISLIQSAAANGAQLVVFPETYIAAFPVWTACTAPIDNHDLFIRLTEESLYVDGPEIEILRQTCRDHGVFAHIGFNEKSHASVGCLWNASILIGDDGTILNHHRKMVPTFYEKLIWANGDAHGLHVADTPIGKIGSLICGENTNPLARFTLMAQGEQVHISTWPAIWPTRRTPDATGKNYDNVAANRTRAAAHCFEAKAFGVLYAGYMDKAMRDFLVEHDPLCADTLDAAQQGVSLFLDPTGAQIGDQVCGQEGIAYADFDLNACVEPKQYHDVVGGYQRLDIFNLTVNRDRQEPVTWRSDLGTPASSDPTRRAV